MKQEKNIWEQSRVELFQKLDCRETGLSQEDAALRLFCLLYTSPSPRD